MVKIKVCVTGSEGEGRGGGEGGRGELGRGGALLYFKTKRYLPIYFRQNVKQY